MVGFKDIKSIGGPPEFQEMLKKLVAQSNTDQEGAALIVNKQGEVKTEEKSVKAEEKNQISKIKKSITEQSRKIISLSNRVDSLSGKTANKLDKLQDSTDDINKRLDDKDKKEESNESKESSTSIVPAVSKRLDAIDRNLSSLTKFASDIKKNLDEQLHLEKRRLEQLDITAEEDSLKTKDKDVEKVEKKDKPQLNTLLGLMALAAPFLLAFESWLGEKRTAFGAWIATQMDSITKAFGRIKGLFDKPNPKVGGKGAAGRAGAGGAAAAREAAALRTAAEGAEDLTKGGKLKQIAQAARGGAKKVLQLSAKVLKIISILTGIRAAINGAKWLLKLGGAVGKTVIYILPFINTLIALYESGGVIDKKVQIEFSKAIGSLIGAIAAQLAATAIGTAIGTLIGGPIGTALGYALGFAGGLVLSWYGAQFGAWIGGLVGEAIFSGEVAAMVSTILASIKKAGEAALSKVMSAGSSAFGAVKTFFGVGVSGDDKKKEVSSSSKPPPGGGVLKYAEKTSASVIESIRNAAKKVGVDVGIMLAMAKQESGFNPNAKAGTSSASGLFQFISSTWNNMTNKYGDKFPELNKGKMDADASAIAGALYIKENSEFLKKNGIPVNGTTIYASHFLGPGGAKKLLSADPSIIGSELLPAAAASNKPIFYDKGGNARTVSQIIEVLYNKVGKTAEKYSAKGGDQLAMNDATASSQKNSKKSAGGSPPAGGSMKPPAQQNVQVAASPVAAAPTASASAPIVIATNSTSDKKETQFGIPNPSFAMKMDDFAAVFFNVNDPHMGVGSA
jgi:hypothetical protein